MEDNATDETVNDKVSETDDVALEANVAKFGDLSSHILEKYRSSKGEGKLNDNEDGTKQKRESKLRDIASRRLSVSARAFANVVTRSIRENKTSKSVKINTMKFEVKNAPKTFNKFKKDPDLLLESLSFLHISDFMIFRSVCKQWSQVLGDGIASSSTLSITSRIQNLGYIPMSFREEDSNHDACADGSADHDLSVASRRRRSRLAFKRVDDHFVMPDTVRRVMAMGRAATSIRFSNVILDRSTLSLLRSFGTRIKSLSLGDIKVYKFTKTKAVEETTSDDESLASVETYGTAQKKSFSVRALPFMRGIHVKDVLGYCGTQLMFLELSVRIGPLPPGIFKSVPRLLSLTALDTVMGKRIKNEKSDIEGTVSLESFVASFAGIELPDLLQLMKDATNESLLLTDKRGNICVGNDAWERMSGYDSSQVVHLNWSFLRGPMTNIASIVQIEDAIRRKKDPTEITTIFSHSNAKAYIAQLAVFPNITTHKGLLLDANSLNQDHITKLATELDDIARNRDGPTGGDAAQTKNFLDRQKVNKYHLFRFGLLCEPFDLSPMVMGAM